MKPVSFLFALALIIQAESVLSRESAGLCDELYKFTCAPGEYNDGTGVAQNLGASADPRRKLSDDNRTRFTKKFRDVLADPENSYFKKIALSAVGLTNAPQCSAGTVNNDRCLADLAQGLGEIAFKEVFPTDYNGTARQVGSYSDLELLLLNPLYRETKDEAVNLAKKALSSPETIEKIQQKIFPEVKKILIEKVKQYVSNEKQRDLLVEKIKGIRFDTSSCFSNRGSQIGDVDKLLTANANYTPASNTFQICNGMIFANRSEFQIVQTIAHELSHSIDPCRIQSGPEDFRFRYSDPEDVLKSETEYPVGGLIACLRRDDSIQAKISTPPKTDDGAPKQKPFETTRPAAKKAPTKDGTPKSQRLAFCNQDQITESVPDWFAAEVLPEYMRRIHPKLTQDQFRLGYSNVWRGMCDGLINLGGSYLDVHPTVEYRINRLVLVNPEVREQMGCPLKHPEFIHCKPGDLSTPVVPNLPPAKPGLPARGIR
jgi:hypothetical protein